MEADFVRHYDRDLAADVEHAGLRKLSVLVHGLPRDAVTWAEETAWTNRDEMQALGLELQDMWGRALFQAWGGKVTGKPLKVPRPDDAEPPPKKELTTDPGDIARFFSQHLREGA